ncbi:MAG: transporter substrate-binding domain-containing protein [Epsilonproteobacteria bacterium]|nr:transporter substrate-binding domain-containing protein [Campylobacterota bacterium]
MRNKQGEWEGISIELWKNIADELDLNYTFKEEKNITSLIRGVKQKELDSAIAAITITSDREKEIDFSHCYYTTNLTIAIAKENQSKLITLLKAFFSYKMLTIILYLTLILFIIGAITWLIERNKNNENFPKEPIRGIGSGIWWAAVTMTTVGYGDMTPKTLGGRLIALFWMFASLLLVSSIIASVTSILISTTKPSIKTPNDLINLKVGSIKDSVSDLYLKERRIYPIYYENISEALSALEQKEIDAVVYDAPLLKYLIKKDFSKTLMVTNIYFNPQHYGIALQTNSPLRESINTTLLKILQTPIWEEIKHKYLGKGEN